MQVEHLVGEHTSLRSVAFLLGKRMDLTSQIVEVV